MRFATSDGLQRDTANMLATCTDGKGEYAIFSTQDHDRVFVFTLSSERGVCWNEPDELALCWLVEKYRCPHLEAALHLRLGVTS